MKNILSASSRAKSGMNDHSVIIDTTSETFRNKSVFGKIVSCFQKTD